MKSATPAFIAWLAANTEMLMAELYDVTLADGTALHYTTFDRNLVISGTTYLSGPPNFTRGTVEEVIGVSKIGTLSLQIHASASDLIGGVPTLQKIARGDFDKAQITVRRLFMDSALNQQGTVIRFAGNIGDLDQLSRTMARFTCKSKVEDLNIQLPPNILQPTCTHTLFDAGCTLNKSAFAVNGTVQAGSTVNKLITNLTQTDSYFDNGQLVFTSGANNGHVAAVRTYTNSGGTVYFFVPLPTAPAIGDTFTIYPGCDKTRADAVNDVKVEFVNRANSYNVEIAEDKDDAGIALYGLKSSTPRQAHAITDATVAKKVANHKRLRSVYIDGGNSYRFTLGWQYILLEPMDLITLTDLNLGLSRHPVRITSIKENDSGELDFEAEDFPWGTATPTAYPYASGAGFAPNQQADPGSVNVPIVFEANNRMSLSTAYELWMGVSAGPNWGGCHVWLSIDGNSYRQIGTIHGPARMGTLTASLASGADPDVSNTLAVDLSQSTGTLTSGTQADADQYHTLCYVDGELISYETATLTGTNKYNLTYVRRGSFGSPISAHSAGSTFLRLDDAVFVYEFDPTLVGKTIYLKFTSFNKFELMEQSLANATAYQFTISGSFGGGVRQATWLPPIFSAVATPSGIIFYWNGTNGSGSLLLYRDDGTPSYAEFGLLAVTGLSANTTYYFYPYVDQSLIVNSLGLDAVQFVGGGVGSPAIALTSRSQAAAVAQGGLNRIPLSDGAIAVTTPSSGTATFTGLGGSLRKV